MTKEEHAISANPHHVKGIAIAHVTRSDGAMATETYTNGDRIASIV
jgi:hypothetical protein